jgi:Ca-activated chloride channel family protein
VNRSLLDGLAAVGRGDALYQLPETPTAEVVDTFLDRIAHPALTDLALDWGGLDVVEVYPERLPDLFAGQAVRVVARVRGPLRDAEVTLTGDAGTESIELRRRLRVADAAAHPRLAAAWAAVGSTRSNRPEDVKSEVKAGTKEARSRGWGWHARCQWVLDTT